MVEKDKRKRGDFKHRWRHWLLVLGAILLVGMLVSVMGPRVYSWLYSVDVRPERDIAYDRMNLVFQPYPEAREISERFDTWTEYRYVNVTNSRLNIMYITSDPIEIVSSHDFFSNCTMTHLQERAYGQVCFVGFDNEGAISLMLMESCCYPIDFDIHSVYLVETNRGTEIRYSYIGPSPRAPLALTTIPPAADDSVSGQ